MAAKLENVKMFDQHAYFSSIFAGFKKLKFLQKPSVSLVLFSDDDQGLKGYLISSEKFGKILSEAISSMESKLENVKIFDQHEYFSSIFAGFK